MRILVEGRNRRLGVEDGTIVDTAGDFDVVISAPRATVRPGLINAHDHLHRNHYGRLGSPPYRDAYEWGADIHRRCETEIAMGRRWPRRDALLYGAWKNLICGVTTVVHHDRWEDDFEREFPLRVAPVRWGHSVRTGIETGPDAPVRGPLAIHLAEGTTSETADEVRTLDRLGYLTSDLLAVHAVGADSDGIARLRSSGAAIVWCPTSNNFLLGRTVPADLIAPGIDLLIGSDSLLSADGDLLDELRAARASGWVADDRLRDAVGEVAARRLDLPAPSLEPGANADVVLLDGDVLDASASDVLMVMVGGVIRVLHPDLIPALGEFGEGGGMMEMRGVARWADQRATVPLMSRQAR